MQINLKNRPEENSVSKEHIEIILECKELDVIAVFSVRLKTEISNQPTPKH